MLEDIPRTVQNWQTNSGKAGAEIKSKAEKELADLYPKDPDGSIPIAYLWARTVTCEAPNCGAEIPLMKIYVALPQAEEEAGLTTHCSREARCSSLGRVRNLRTQGRKRSWERHRI